MTKLLLIITIILRIFGLAAEEREDYYVFSFDDFTIVPGYDDVDFLRLTFDPDLPDMLAPGKTLEGRDMFFWDDFFACIDVKNETDEEIFIGQAKLTKFIYYLSNYPFDTYKLDGIELSESVKENCERFRGEYVERNGYACAIGRKVYGKKNVVILYGDIFGIDQDKLDHIEIYVE